MPPQVTETQQEPNGRPPVRAAQYVRMSTDHQQYSTENQAEVIAEYARTHHIEIVRTYADEGKSGLRRGPRPAAAADRRRRERCRQFPGGSGLRRQPVGPV